MKTSYIIGIIVGLGIIGGGIWYANSNGVQKEASTEQGSQQGQEVVIDGKYNGSIYDIAKSGKSYKCSVTQNTQGVTTNGTVYVSGEKVRGEFQSVIPSYGSITSSMISDAEFVYTWNSMQAQGMKFKRSEDSVTASGDTSTSMSGQSFDLNQSYEYDCVAENVDASKFDVPSNIVFKAY